MKKSLRVSVPAVLKATFLSVVGPQRFHSIGCRFVAGSYASSIQISHSFLTGVRFSSRSDIWKWNLLHGQIYSIHLYEILRVSVHFDGVIISNHEINRYSLKLTVKWVFWSFLLEDILFWKQGTQFLTLALKNIVHSFLELLTPYPRQTQVLCDGFIDFLICFSENFLLSNA